MVQLSMATTNESDPAKAAFLAALKKKNSKEGGKPSDRTESVNTPSKSAGPGSSRRNYQRRSGSA